MGTADGDQWHIKVLLETKRTIGFVLLKNVFQLQFKAHIGAEYLVFSPLVPSKREKNIQTETT